MVNNVAVKVSNLSKEFFVRARQNCLYFERCFFIYQLWGICINTWCQWFWKSTLLSCLSSLSEPTSGEVVINGINPYTLKEGRLAKFRRQDIELFFKTIIQFPNKKQLYYKESVKKEWFHLLKSFTVCYTEYMNVTDDCY